MSDDAGEVLPVLESVGFRSGRPGPALIVTGAVHGNETCGPVAISRVVEAFLEGRLQLARGRVSFVPVVNPKAYARKTREGDRNLNRNLAPRPAPQDFEDHIANALCPMLAGHDVLLDIHSFTYPGAPFVFVGPEDNDGPLEPFSRSAEERAFARALGVPTLLTGWLKAYAGAVAEVVRLSNGTVDRATAFGVGTTEYMRSQGGMAVTLECGHHEDPEAPEVAHRAILNALAHLGLIAGERPALIPEAPLIRLQKAHIRMDEGDRFEQAWSHLDRVSRGTVLGRYASGDVVRAPTDGYIIFPNPASKRLAEWFYFAKEG